MAVTAPQITPLPDPPLPTDAEAVFDAKAGASLTAQQAMVPQINTSLTWIADQVNASESYKNTAANSATASAASATSASASQSAAATSAQTAQAAAVAAGAATGLGPLGQEGDVIQVKAGRTGVGYAPINKVGDVLITAQPMAMPWVPANGGVRSVSSLPTLAAALGKLGGQVGTLWSSPAIPAVAVDVTSAPNETVQGGPTRVMTVTSAGAVSFSADGGQTFAAATATGLSIAYSAAYDEATNSWLIPGLVSSTPTLAVSTDNGATWTTKALPVACLKVVPSITGTWLALPSAAGTAVYRSTNGGTSWTAVTSGTSVAHVAAATDGKGVWCIATAGGIRRSADDGQTWASMTSTAVVAISTNKQGVWFYGVSSSASVNSLAKSVDNGLTWASVTQPASATINDIAYSMGFFFFVRSAQPQVMFISDQADATTYTTPSGNVLANASKITATDGYVTAIASAITTTLRSYPVFQYDTATQFQLPDFPVARGLRAWIKAALQQVAAGAFTVVGSAPVTIVDIAYDGDKTLMLLTATEIRKSVDRGVTWTSVKTESSGMLARIAHMGGTNWFAVGSVASSGRQSSDGGSTWTNVTAVSGSVKEICAAKNGKAVTTYIGASPRITSDYGKTWSSLSATSLTTTSACTNGSGTWLILGNYTAQAGIISRDDFANWQSFSAPDATTGTTEAIQGLAMNTNGETLLLANSAAGCLFSSNLSSWVRKTRPAGISQLVSVGAGAFRCSSGFSLYTTTDYSNTWSYVATPNGVPRLTGGQFTDLFIGYATNVAVSVANTWI